MPLLKIPLSILHLFNNFGKTAAANTLDTREVQIIATIDGKVKLVSEASIRRHLKLEDFDGISAFPNTKIFKQLTLMGVKDQQSQLSPITHPQVLQQPHNHHFHHPLGYKPDKKLRVLALETDLQHTKKVYSTIVTKLIMKGKKIDEIDQDPNISLVPHGAEVQGRHEQETEFETKEISTAETLVYIRRSAFKNKGKGIMIESEPEQTSTKLQQRQERAGYEAAIRLQEQLDKEERQRIARVHEEAISFNVEEWEDIQATIKADEALALKIQPEERENIKNLKKQDCFHTLKQLKKLSFEELKNLFEATMKRVKTFTLVKSDFDRTIPKIPDESSKRAAEEELEQESSKRQKTRESSEPREKEDDELT
uniref:Xylulose kinase-1 n=1 Tax=Tanacetum cinerariifolium TaxID=118510 RepID=A0A6L2LIM2_TANCI|nr:hypothetical protein [Tanacetum cinerariifolium]